MTRMIGEISRKSSLLPRYLPLSLKSSLPAPTSAPCSFNRQENFQVLLNFHIPL